VKVLHLVSHLNAGGITRYLLTLAQEQRQAGYQVYVWGARGDFLPDVRSVAVEVFDSVPRTKSELSPRLWMSLPGLLATVKEHSIDILHAHTRITQTLAAAASKITGVPFVTTAHGFYTRRIGRRLLPCWGRMIFAISRAVRDGLISTFGIDHLPRIIVVPNGIDLGALQTKLEHQDPPSLRREYGYSPKDILVLSLSRLKPSKGIHLLIAAFNEARKTLPAIRLLIAGGGDEAYLAELRAQAEKLGIAQEVCFLGNVFEITRLLAIADIFAAPYFAPEGFGLSILEAMASRVPVIASNIPGISELLEGGSLGLLFKERDAQDLARVIAECAQNKALRDSLAERAYSASARYSSELMFEQVDGGYRRVLGESAP